LGDGPFKVLALWLRSPSAPAAPEEVEEEEEEVDEEAALTRCTRAPNPSLDVDSATSDSTSSPRLSFLTYFSSGSCPCSLSSSFSLSLATSSLTFASPAFSLLAMSLELAPVPPPKPLESIPPAGSPSLSHTELAKLSWEFDFRFPLSENAETEPEVTRRMSTGMPQGGGSEAVLVLPVLLPVLREPSPLIGVPSDP